MNFTGGRLRQEFDFLDTLAQFIEGGDAALEERASIRCGALTTVPGSIEEANAQRMLELGDRLGYHRLRDREVPRRPCHASPLHHRKQDGASPAIRTVTQFDPQAACEHPIAYRLCSPSNTGTFQLSCFLGGILGA